ncbi:MAG TPA: hypothetical protein PKC24_00320 [Cyclobacteriaceae bacterium]|nr:hypothetical protein [Cyclobacteriaceae bacterium]
MNTILIFVLAAFIVQVLIFFFVRKQKEERSAVIIKYNIRTAGDAFRLLNDPHVPEEDRIEIEKYYQDEIK